MIEYIPAKPHIHPDLGSESLRTVPRMTPLLFILHAVGDIEHSIDFELVGRSRSRHPITAAGINGHFSVGKQSSLKASHIWQQSNSVDTV